MRLSEAHVPSRFQVQQVEGRVVVRESAQHRQSSSIVTKSKYKVTVVNGRVQVTTSQPCSADTRETLPRAGPNHKNGDASGAVVNVTEEEEKPKRKVTSKYEVTTVNGWVQVKESSVTTYER